MASTTASSVYTTTVSQSGSQVVQTSTGFGLALAQATDAASASGDASSSSESGNAAPAATGFPGKLAGSAAGAAGILGAALLL